MMHIRQDLFTNHFNNTPSHILQELVVRMLLQSRCNMLSFPVLSQPAPAAGRFLDIKEIGGCRMSRISRVLPLSHTRRVVATFYHLNLLYAQSFYHTFDLFSSKNFFSERGSHPREPRQTVASYVTSVFPNSVPPLCENPSLIYGDFTPDSALSKFLVP